MICFEISINGKRKCSAGADAVCVLSGSVVWKDGDRPRRTVPPGAKTFLRIEVGGLIDREGGYEHLKWLEEPLSVGDEITFRVRETTEADEPLARSYDNAKIH